MTSHAQDREETIWRLAQEAWRLDDIRSLLRYSATVQRIAVAECNRELTITERSANRRAQKRIEALCTKYGCSARFGGDPRGYCVKLTLPSGSHNTWGGKEAGWGVPAKG